MSAIPETPLPLASVTDVSRVILRELGANSDPRASSQPQTAAVPASNAMPDAAHESATTTPSVAYSLQPLVSKTAQSVTRTLQAAIASQDGIAQLMTDLVQAQKTPGLPAPVQAAIVQILAVRSPIDGALTAAAVKEALTHSGLFSEANVASDLRATTPGTQARLGVPDIKTALLVLQQALNTWLAGAPAAARDGAADRLRSPTNRPPPPYRGGPTSAQSSSPPSLPVDADPQLVGAVLTRRTDAALAHMKLLQIASLPERASADQTPGSRWMFEIPFATPQGSMVAQFEVSRDPSGVTDEQSEQVWRARFSLNVEPVGPVHAQLALMGERAWVTLWAEREAGMQTLREGEALLTQALHDSDLVAKIAFFLGAPRSPVGAPGQVLDSDS